MALHRMSIPLLAIGVAACVAACAVGPNYVTPDVDVPGSFSTGHSDDPAGKPTVEADSRWWHTLGDAELNSLVRGRIANRGSARDLFSDS
jgi:outer membrane protein, multidrug efflux system